MAFGDTSGTLSGSQKGKNQDLVGTLSSFLVGDAEAIIDSASGGNDSLTGGDSRGLDVVNQLFGDARRMSGSAQGGNDVLTGGDTSSDGDVFNAFVGDATEMSGSAQGGNDVLTGGDNSGSGHVDNFLFGDAGTMSESAQGGNDELTGGDNSGIGEVDNFLFGDAIGISAQGGNDKLIGGDNSGSGSVANFLVGDAQGAAQGGDDELTGGDNSGSGHVSNILIGDAVAMSGSGGDDRLISGINATDQMWGDAQDLSASATGGNDTFVFAGAFGSDSVNDFRQGEDTIEFQVAGVADFDDLVFTPSGSDTVISTTASATDTVTLVGIDPLTLTASDFLFT